MTNLFLGAVGSLFGLVRLLKLDRDQSPKPDLIIFEYVLNDAILVKERRLATRMIRDTLDEVAQYCAERRIGLLFLDLQPRDARSGPFSPTARVMREYALAARMRAMRPCLTLKEILGRSPSAACYQDSYHLTESASRLVAESLLALLRRGDAIPPPLAAPPRPPSFSYVAAEQAVATGRARLQGVECKVFSGNFLEIERPGASFWPGRGRLVALMLRSSETAGLYMMKNATKAYRKCSASTMQGIVANLVLLHYVSHRLDVEDDLEISMPGDAANLFALEKDGTMQEAEPVAPFPEQRLEINGVMLWRPVSLWRRSRARLALARERGR